MTKKSKLPKLSFESWAINMLVIHYFFMWLPLFIVTQLKKIALKTIQIALIPIDAVEQSFGLVLEGLAKDFEELPCDSESETEDPSIV